MNFSNLKEIGHKYRIKTNRLLRNIRNRSKSDSLSHYFVKEFNVDKKHLFFGYYDVSPFNDKNLMLACIVDSKDNNMEIGYYDLDSENNLFTKVSESRTWCWQMGCRLQWFRGSDNLIFFNDVLDGKYASRILDIKNREDYMTLDSPLYCLTKDGNYGLSLNFTRLEALRPGYGYSLFPESNLEVGEPDNDGIFLIDTGKNTSKLLFSIKDISNFERESSMENAVHYLNHLLFNPDGNKFLFFHCWLKAGIKKVRTLVSDIDGKNLGLISNSDSVLSHYNWINSNEIICYQGNGFSGKGYYKHNIKDSKFRKLDKYPHNNLDGHPTLWNDFLVTDTVPDQYSDRHLSLFDIQSNSFVKLASLYSPLGLVKKNRCDFHPKLNSKKTLISIDSAHNNLRSMLVFDIGNLVSRQ